MQSSVDRDDYVNIKWENIPEEYEQNFKAYLTTDFGLGYDYLSVMHYGEFAFSENDEPTLTTKVIQSLRNLNILPRIKWFCSNRTNNIRK